MNEIPILSHQLDDLLGMTVHAGVHLKAAVRRGGHHPPVLVRGQAVGGDEVVKGVAEALQPRGPPEGDAGAGGGWVPATGSRPQSVLSCWTLEWGHPVWH